MIRKSAGIGGRTAFCPTVVVAVEPLTKSADAGYGKACGHCRVKPATTACCQFPDLSGMSDLSDLCDQSDQSDFSEDLEPEVAL